MLLLVAVFILKFITQQWFPKSEKIDIKNLIQDRLKLYVKSDIDILDFNTLSVP